MNLCKPYKLDRILDRLNAANEILDMNYPGSNLHKLQGDKKDQYAVKAETKRDAVIFLSIGGNQEGRCYLFIYCVN